MRSLARTLLAPFLLRSFCYWAFFRSSALRGSGFRGLSGAMCGFVSVPAFSYRTRPDANPSFPGDFTSLPGRQFLEVSFPSDPAKSYCMWILAHADS